MKKIAVLALAFVFILALVACGNANATQLGISDFSIVLPEGYVLTTDDLLEDQVAYFYKDDESVDLDVYQWIKGDNYTLEGEAKTYAEEYGTTAEPVTVNGINGWKYVSIEDFEGIDYTVVNYMFEDDTYIVEICFWTDNSEAEHKVVDEIISTLKKN